MHQQKQERLSLHSVEGKNEWTGSFHFTSALHAWSVGGMLWGMYIPKTSMWVHTHRHTHK